MIRPQLRNDQTSHALIRARVLSRLGARRRSEVDTATLQERLAAASDDIRNALVPLQTIAELLQVRHDKAPHDWCASTLRHEVKHIVDILEGLSA